MDSLGAVIIGEFKDELLWELQNQRISELDRVLQKNGSSSGNLKGDEFSDCPRVVEL